MSELSPQPFPFLKHLESRLQVASCKKDSESLSTSECLLDNVDSDNQEEEEEDDDDD